MAVNSIFSTPKTQAYAAIEETTPGEGSAPSSAPLPHSKYQGKAAIGEGVHVKGDIHDCRQVDVHGLMEGEIEADILIIHEKGSVKGGSRPTAPKFTAKSTANSRSRNGSIYGRRGRSRAS